MLNLAVGDTAIDVVGHNIEVERAGLGETSNGIALAGDTGNHTISGVTGFAGLELICSGGITGINLHIPHVGPGENFSQQVRNNLFLILR